MRSLTDNSQGVGLLQESMILKLLWPDSTPVALADYRGCLGVLPLEACSFIYMTAMELDRIDISLDDYEAALLSHIPERFATNATRGETRAAIAEVVGRVISPNFVAEAQAYIASIIDEICAADVALLAIDADTGSAIQNAAGTSSASNPVRTRVRAIFKLKRDRARAGADRRRPATAPAAVQQNHHGELRDSRVRSRHDLSSDARRLEPRLTRPARPSASAQPPGVPQSLPERGEWQRL